MYKFIDVTETQEGISLPSEALRLNGEYIENLIPGYRTLTVEGREALSPEISSFDTGLRDGSVMKGKRYPARVLRITYQLIAESNAAFREAFNKLGAILDVTDARLIFADEEDKYYTGTPSYIGEVEPGKNAVVGVFEITCLDPFKYSVMEYEISAERGESSVWFNYNGTYKSFPTLQANLHVEDEASEDGNTVVALTGDGDCGYVAFFNEDEKIIQIGDPDEVDGEELEKSQTLVNQTFDKTTSFGAAAKSLWSINNGITSSDAVVQTGQMGMGVASYSTPIITDKHTELLRTRSTAGDPSICYVVKSVATGRTANNVTVKISVDVWLENKASYFGNGYSLYCKVYIGDRGITKTLILKDAQTRWEGTELHTKSFTVTLSAASDITSIGGVQFEAYRPDTTGGTAGTIKKTTCPDIVIPKYVAPSPTSYFLCPTSYGTGTDWHGPSITRTLPADDAGIAGANNFSLSYKQKLPFGKGADNLGNDVIGAFQVLLTNGNKIVAGANVYKGGTGKKVTVRLYLNGAVKETLILDMSVKPFNPEATSTITKYGKTVTFNICGVKKEYNVPAITETAVTKFTFTFSAFGTKPYSTNNGLYWVKFVKNNCDTWKNVQNKFGANDVIEAVCKDGKILLNGVDTPALGALGNDWEGLYLKPGINQIGFAYSDWVNPEFAPTFKVKYREVFL